MNLFRDLVVVRLERGHNFADSVATVCSDVGVEPDEAWPPTFLFFVRLPQDDDGRTIQGLLAHPLVADADYDYPCSHCTVSAQAPKSVNDSMQPFSLGHWEHNVWEAIAWAQQAGFSGFGDPTIKVASPDTGYSTPLNHGSADFVADMPEPNPALCYDSETQTYGDITKVVVKVSADTTPDHGNMVYGTNFQIANNGTFGAGICPSCTPVVARSGTAGTWGTSSYAAINRAASAAVGLGARIVTLSWANFGIAPLTPYSSLVDAANNGCLCFQAAGNGSVSITKGISTPSRVFFCGALASYSNFGPGVDLVVTPTWTSGLAFGGVGSGTSNSTPAAAGIAALVWSLNPAWLASEVETILRASVVPMGADFNARFPRAGGALNAALAVRNGLAALGRPITGTRRLVGRRTQGLSPPNVNLDLVDIIHHTSTGWLDSGDTIPVWLERAGGVARVELWAGSQMVYGGPPTTGAVVPTLPFRGTSCTMLRAWWTGHDYQTNPPDLFEVYSDLIAGTPYTGPVAALVSPGVYSATVAYANDWGSGEEDDPNDWTPYIQGVPPGVTVAWSPVELSSPSLAISFSGVTTPFKVTITTLVGDSDVAVGPAPVPLTAAEADAYYAPMSGALPGTLPAAGELSAGQSKSYPVQSAGGPFRFEIPAAGDGVLEVLVAGIVQATLIFGDILTSGGVPLDSDGNPLTSLP